MKREMFRFSLLPTWR